MISAYADIEKIFVLVWPCGGYSTDSECDHILTVKLLQHSDYNDTYQETQHLFIPRAHLHLDKAKLKLFYE